MSMGSPKLGKVPAFHSQAGEGLVPARGGLWPGDTWAIPAGPGNPTLRAGHQTPQPLCKK